MSFQPNAYQILVTGPSGSGKSFFAKKLEELGYPAFDADKIPGLASWHDKSGMRVKTPSLLSQSFLTQQRFLWDKQTLKSFLKSHRQVLLFGISHNSRQLAQLFDQVALLKLSLDEIVQNLVEESRDNIFGKNDEHLDMARTDTIEYYRDAPDDWLPLKAHDPELLISELSQQVGFKI